VVGKTLGHYEILAPLGAGGMGEVYRARDTILEREVAIKLLPKELAADPQRLARLEREAKLLASLNHPHIAAIYSLEEDEGVRFLVLELVEGDTLEDRLARGRQDISETLEIARQMAEALEAAHEKGIVHRDLKPANLKITADGKLKVLDFGIAKAPESGQDKLEETSGPTGLTVDGTLMGTIPYMSPEQIRGQEADQRTDIWAFGCVLYESLTGRRPFDLETASDTFVAILSSEPDWNALPENLPDTTKTLIQRCLRKEPEQRLHHIADARIEITETLGDSLRATPPLAAKDVGSPRQRRWRSAAAALALAAIAAVVVAGGLWLWGGTYGPELDPELLVVMPFANRTGDPAFDSFSELTTAAVAQGIAQIDTVVVAPSIGGAELDPETAGLAEHLASARGRGAGTVISGELFLHEGDLRFQAQMIDVDLGEILYAVEPVSDSADHQANLLEALQQRVMGMVAVHFGIEGSSPGSSYIQNMVGSPELWSKLPDFDAYREYLSGMEVYGRDGEESFSHFQRAAELDPQFIPPLFWVESAYRNRGDWHKVEEIVEQLDQQRDSLSPYERGRLGYARAILDADLREARRCALVCLELHPAGDPLRYVIESFDLALNEPGEVIATFAEWEPTEQFNMGSPPGTWIFRDWTQALHLLEDYEAELAVAERGLGYYPNYLTVREQEVRALAALGRTGEIQSAIDDSLTVSRQEGTPDAVMLTAAEELIVHGHQEAGGEMADRAVDWLRNRPPQDQKPADLARALFVAGHWQDARAAYETLVDQAPDEIEYLGHLGATLAHLGDVDAARRIASDLRAIDRQYLFGRPAYWQAAIAATLGDSEGAISLIREWISQAFGIDYVALHHDSNFESLREHPGFQEILRPKG
jgi:tetratricopeptide (TPR) repeat protein